MGIAPYKYFTFDGVSSRNYDVYLTGTGVFNAPQRAVELLEIPGRNGNYALDQGRFNNITVTYKAGIVDYSESNFADKVSALRNWLCSKVGYKRLEDDYNPNEYRMAVFANGINVDHEDLRTGEFEITFECKPQRWLTSGETATAVANNGTLSNPTLFDSEPLLAVKGYGGIHFNGYNINIEDGTLGDVIIADSDTIQPESSTASKTYTIPQGTYETGDSIDVNIASVYFAGYSIRTINHTVYFNGATKTVADSNASFTTTCETRVDGLTPDRVSGYFPQITTVPDTITFTAGTNSTVTNNATVTYTVPVYQRGSHTLLNTATVVITVTTTITYDATARTISLSVSASKTNNDSTNIVVMWSVGPTINNVGIVLHSTATSLGNPTYIDCEIGECYMIKNSEIITLNNVISLGSDLPKLSSGTNTFTYDNTITELKVTPRYWKV